MCLWPEGDCVSEKQGEDRGQGQDGQRAGSGGCGVSDGTLPGAPAPGHLLKAPRSLSRGWGPGLGDRVAPDSHGPWTGVICEIYLHYQRGRETAHLPLTK